MGASGPCVDLPHWYAVLRTHIQHCQNTRFIFAGSQRHMMAEIFASPSRPFYQSTSMMSLAPIDIDKNVEFAQGLFREYRKDIGKDTNKHRTNGERDIPFHA